MTMTLEDRAKLAVYELHAQFPGPDAQTEYVLNMLRLAVADERAACAEIADGHWVADTIRARSEPQAGV